MRRKNLLFALAVLSLFLFSLMNVSAASNLIPNSGFEQDDDDWKFGCWWEVSCDGEIVDNLSHNGDKSVKLIADGVESGKEFAVSSISTEKMIKLKKNTEYELTALVYMEEDADLNEQLPRMSLALYLNESDWEINAWANPATAHRVDFQSKVFPDVKTGQWEQIKIDVSTDSEHTIGRLWLISLAPDGGDEDAVVWFDDASLREKDDDDDNDNRDKLGPRGEFLFSDGCVSDWQCSGWSACTEDGQTRQCYDANNCELPTETKPLEAMGCVEEIVENSLVDVEIQSQTFSQNQPNYLLWVLIATAVILIIVLIIVAMRD